MAGSEVVLSVEEQPGKPADGSDHKGALDDLKSKFDRVGKEETPSSSMAGSEVVLSVEEQPGKPADGSDHKGALDDLKSKFDRVGKEETPSSSMAGSEVVLSVEEQPGKPAHRSDHKGALDDLKSKFDRVGKEETPSSSMAGSEVVLSVEEQPGKPAHRSDHKGALDDLKSKFDRVGKEETPSSSMAGSEVVLSVEEQPGKPADGSDHKGALDDLKSKFDLLEIEETPPSSSSSKLRCPKIPKRLRSEVKDAENYYAPKLISLGPYSHGESRLARGETLKFNLAKSYFKEYCWLTVDDIYCKIFSDIDVLKASYDKESTKKYEDEEFAAMMLVDGCALLRYILCVGLGDDHEDFNITYQDISHLHQDALLLENQLPYQLLQMLMNFVMVETELEFGNVFWKAIFQQFFGMNDKSFYQEFLGEESFLQKMIKPKQKTTDNEPKPCHHLLDLFRRNFLGNERSSSPTHTENENSKDRSSSDTEFGRKLGRESVRDVKEVMASFRNVKELMAAGIRIKRSPTRHLRDISFRSNGITACLRIPPITIDNSTKAMFFNLIAYEMSSNVPHDFISYLRFLDSLIDHADDVKELQSIGILQNNLGTHEEVAEFFNTVSAKLESNFHAYKDVRVRIRKHFRSHYNSKLKMWITQCLDTYFGSPWTIIAWIGAALALFFTAVQTYFSVFHH